MFPFRVKDDHINYKSNDPYFIPCAKVIGLNKKRRKTFRTYSIVNISAMSYGSLSSQAQSAFNKGAAMVGSFHNTGEGAYLRFINWVLMLFFSLVLAILVAVLQEKTVIDILASKNLRS